MSIVGENGMGKTTLVTAIAACLAGTDQLFPSQLFDRLGQDETSYAYLELELNDERGAIVRWTSPEAEKEPDFSPYILNKLQTHPTWLVPDWIFPWFTSQEIPALPAAYGVYRDIKEPETISQYQKLESHPLADILNPFAPLPANEIFQWIANQHVNYALALAENEEAEANAYLQAIQRIEQLLSDVLEMQISFKVKRNPFRLEVAHDGIPLSIDQLSDGTRSFMSWPLDYLMRASRVNWAVPTDSVRVPGLILVDEIDAHLHPEWQRRVMSMVNQLLPETYIIATTHSPFVVAAADDAYVFRLYKDQSGNLQVKSSFDEFYGYPADLVLEKTFVPSLYPLEMEHKLQRLSDLAGKQASNTISESEKEEHDITIRNT